MTVNSTGETSPAAPRGSKIPRPVSSPVRAQVPTSLPSPAKNHPHRWVCFLFSIIAFDQKITKPLSRLETKDIIVAVIQFELLPKLVVFSVTTYVLNFTFVLAFVCIVTYLHIMEYLMKYSSSPTVVFQSQCESPAPPRRRGLPPRSELGRPVPRPNDPHRLSRGLCTQSIDARINIVIL